MIVALSPYPDVIQMLIKNKKGLVMSSLESEDVYAWCIHCKTKHPMTRKYWLFKRAGLKCVHTREIVEKIASRLRSRISWPGQKTASHVGDLGCSLGKLMRHLESKFYDRRSGEAMSWKNYGINGWHIDHVRPISSFNLLDPVEAKKACHFTNLQPLWIEDNLAKGSSLDWGPKRIVK